MNTIEPADLIEQLNWRYATKKFDPNRKINPRKWAALEESVLLTPSSFGLQPWKIISVTDPSARQELLPFSYGQEQIVQASHLLVFAIKNEITERDVDRFIERIAQVRSVPAASLAGYRDMLVGSIINGMDRAARRVWASRQAYIALGNFLNSAALLGIDACPMEGFQPADYDRILHLDKQGLTAVVIATAGYRSPEDRYAALKKVRSPREEVLIEV